jgi:hypothetical protein
MGTLFSEVYDVFLMDIQDYRLDNLHETNITQFTLFLKGLLVTSKDLFNSSFVDLSYTNATDANGVDDSYFNETLTSKEISILAMYVTYRWMERECNDIRQFSLHMSTRDFKIASEANNLKQKVEWCDQLRERVNYEVIQYQNNNLDKIPFFSGV